MLHGTSKQHFPEALRKLSVRELMKRTGLSSKTIQRAKNGERVHPKTARRLLWCARLLKKPVAASKLRGKTKAPRSSDADLMKTCAVPRGSVDLCIDH